MDSIKMMEQDLYGKTLEFSSMSKEDTVLVVVDMVEGFVNHGALASPRVSAMSGHIADLCSKMKDYQKIFFVDSHNTCAAEFESFPPHCVNGTAEVDIIDSLKSFADDFCSLKIEKNSTNGFLSNKFQQWFQDNDFKVKNYIVTGCVTDMCVMQFALTLKACFNERNLQRRIIVPADCVETYDLGSHSGNLMGLFALYSMHCAGIEIVDKIV